MCMLMEKRPFNEMEDDGLIHHKSFEMDFLETHGNHGSTSVIRG